MHYSSLVEDAILLEDDYSLNHIIQASVVDGKFLATLEEVKLLSALIDFGEARQITKGCSYFSSSGNGKVIR